MFFYNNNKHNKGSVIMFVIAKPIDMLAWFDDDGNTYPVKFKITNKDEILYI